MRTFVACLCLLTAAPVLAQSPAPLSEIRNYHRIDDRLTTAGQIGDDQIALLKAEGFEVVINLAPARAEVNEREAFLVAEQGLAYINIPVDWEAPALDHVRLFLDVMAANADRKVFVHCFANMRASAFTYLYRTLAAGVPDAEARADMHAIWDPADRPQWQALIDSAKAAFGN